MPSSRQAEPTFAGVRWPSDEAFAWAARCVPALCATPNTLAVVFFGSAVRPVDISGDLDVLYIFSGDRPGIDPAPLDVDVRGYAEPDVEPLIMKAHDLLGWAIRYGRLMCERHDYWTSLVARWDDTMPWPDPERSLARAEKAEALAAQLAVVGDADAAEEQQLSALTHRARARLLESNVFPASRPELPGQLRAIGERVLADSVARAVVRRNERLQSW